MEYRDQILKVLINRSNNSGRLDRVFNDIPQPERDTTIKVLEREGLVKVFDSGKDESMTSKGESMISFKMVQLTDEGKTHAISIK